MAFAWTITYANATRAGQVSTVQWLHARAKTIARATVNVSATICVNATPTGWAIHAPPPTARV